MTTATKKAPKAKKADDGLKNDPGAKFVDIRYIMSNQHQARGDGVCLNLQAAGVGVFSPLAEGGKAILPLLLSKDPLERAEGVKLVKEHEAEALVMAASLAKDGNLNGIMLSPYINSEGEVVEGRWNIVTGFHRVLGKAVEFAASDGNIDPILKCHIRHENPDSPNALLALSLKDNHIRKNMTVLDYAKTFLRMMTTRAMNPKQIADEMGMDYYTTRLYCQVARMSKEMQEAIRNGLPYTTALKIDKDTKGKLDDKARAALVVACTDKTPEEREQEVVKAIAKAEAEKGGSSGGGGGGGSSAPAVAKPKGLKAKQMEDMYLLTEKPDAMSEDLWDSFKEQVRIFIAVYLGLEYKTRKQLKDEAREAERQRQIAEAAIQSASPEAEAELEQAAA